jgi:hypothetical protein
MTSESVMLGSSVRCFENRRMYSHRDSPGCWRQLRRSQEFPGRTYVPWKFPAKALTRSSQLEICEEEDAPARLGRRWRGIGGGCG